MKDKRILAGGGALIIAVAGFWFFIKPEFLDAAPAEQRPLTQEEIATAPRPTIELEEMVLNLVASPGRESFVRIEIALEFADPDHAYVRLSPSQVRNKNEAFAENLDPQMHRVRDTVHSVIGSTRAADVSTPQGREELKEELRTSLNEQLHDYTVEQVYFITFITQTVVP